MAPEEVVVQLFRGGLLEGTDRRHLRVDSLTALPGATSSGGRGRILYSDGHVVEQACDWSAQVRKLDEPGS